jgi:hypothetical protein
MSYVRPRGTRVRQALGDYSSCISACAAQNDPDSSDETVLTAYGNCTNACSSSSSPATLTIGTGTVTPAANTSPNPFVPGGTVVGSGASASSVVAGLSTTTLLLIGGAAVLLYMAGKSKGAKAAA